MNENIEENFARKEIKKQRLGKGKMIEVLIIE